MRLLKLLAVGAAPVAALLFGAVAHADPLPIPQLPPNVAVFNVDITYTGGTFTATGTTANIDGIPLATQGTFTLTASFNEATGKLSSTPESALLNVTGNGGTLYHGTSLLAFADAAQQFEFEFVQDGGTLGTIGNPLGVFLKDSDFPTAPDMKSDFSEPLFMGMSNTYAGTANVFTAAPLPSSAYAGISLLICVGAFRLVRSSRKITA